MNNIVIYVIGYVFALVAILLMVKYENKHVTVGTLIGAIFLAIFSWLALAIIPIVVLGVFVDKHSKKKLF